MGLGLPRGHTTARSSPCPRGRLERRHRRLLDTQQPNEQRGLPGGASVARLARRRRQAVGVFSEVRRGAASSHRVRDKTKT